MYAVVTWLVVGTVVKRRSTVASAAGLATGNGFVSLEQLPCEFFIYVIVCEGNSISKQRSFAIFESTEFDRCETHARHFLKILAKETDDVQIFDQSDQTSI